MDSNDLQTIEGHLRRIANALERMSPPPAPRSKATATAPTSGPRDTSEPDIDTTGF